MHYDLVIVGAGPGGLMAARTAARDGLKVLLVERRRQISNVRRYCSQMIRVGTGGFSSRKIPADRVIRSIYVIFDIDYQSCVLHLKNVGDEVSITYKGMLAPYCNETWVSPSGCYFSTEATDNHIYGFQIDKAALLAGLEQECRQSGCAVQCATVCRDIAESAQTVTLTMNGLHGSDAITAERVILADGAFSGLVERMGFNRDRSAGGPRLKFLTYILDRVESPFSPDHYMQLCAPSIFPGQINLGLWTNRSFHLGIAAPLFTHMDLAGVLDRIMKDSPFAPWFKASKVLDRLGCTMSLRPAIREPARGRVICCGDSAAFAETAIKGALGCGYKAARASKAALEGEDGDRQYNAFWQQAFYFHSRQYLSFSKETYPVARVLSDGEVDLLYRWIHDHNLGGLPGDLLSDNLNRLRAELPSITEKLRASPSDTGLNTQKL
jgi:flavin-dependent dehydrogenase